MTGPTGPVGYPTSRTVVSTSTYSASGSEQYFGVTYNGAVAISLAAGVTNQIQIVKDERGTASTQNITITAHGAEAIDGQSSVVLAINYGALTLWYNSGWHII